jgi:hypothetical protein
VLEVEEPVVLPAVAAYLVLVDESVAAAVVDVVELFVAAVEFVLEATAVVLGVLDAEVDVAAMHAPRVAVASTLITAVAILDRWAMRPGFERLGGRRGVAGWLVMAVMIRGASKTATNRM